MKKTGVIILVVCLLLCTVPVSAEEAIADSSVVNGCNTLDGKIPFLGTEQLVKNGKAMVLYEVNTDTLMYAHNADTQLPPASLLKILTALIAIEKGNLADVVTVSQEVLSTLDPEAAVVEPALVAGEVVTVQDLLYCMMVASGNDAAVILADHVMGSQKAFVAEMNNYAAELGCTGTNFTNVHGLHDKNQYTTARDVARILARAVQNQDFCEIFNTRKYVVPNTNKSESRILLTQNYLLNKDSVIIHYDERVKGSRTGVTNDNTHNIASLAESGNMRLICVVMGAASVYENGAVKVFGGYGETQKLLDLGFEGNKAAQLLHENQVLRQLSVPGGSSDVTIGTKNPVFSVIPESVDINSLDLRYVNETALSAPVQEGQLVSTLQIWCNQICVAETDVFAMSSVLPAGQVFTEDVIVKKNVNYLRIILYVMGVALAAAMVWVIIFSLSRANRIAQSRRQSRRNSRNRRRSR